MPEPETRHSASPAAVRATDLTVRFHDAVAVDGVDLDLPPGSLTALLGPSGCGKSTTLAVLAGLVRQQRGRVEMDGRAMDDVPPERRPVSLVFQRPLLFPHLSVAENVGFGLRMRRLPRRRVRTEVEEMLQRVRLDGFGGRRPHELSGGQEQRVALARALVQRPRLLLLDEPFSQLDADLRAEMRALVRELHDESGVTTLFVTHDRDEAVELADGIALMLDGRVAATGAPEDFYTRPPSLVAARFFGVRNELPGTVEGGWYTPAGGSLRLATTLPDGPALLVVRPEALGLAPTADGPQVVVSAVRFAGTHLVVEAAPVLGPTVVLHLPLGTPIAVGDRSRLVVPADRATVLALEER